MKTMHLCSGLNEEKKHYVKRNIMHDLTVLHTSTCMAEIFWAANMSRANIQILYHPCSDLRLVTRRE